MPKDFTKYRFNEDIYSKRKIVKSVVEDYINAHNNLTFEMLEKVFPPEIQKDTKLKIASFDVVRKVSDISASDDKHYFPEKISLADGIEVRINGDWGSDNIISFIERARKLGYTIEEIKN